MTESSVLARLNSPNWSSYWYTYLNTPDATDVNDFIVEQFKTLHEEYAAPPSAVSVLLCVRARTRGVCVRVCMSICLSAGLFTSPCLSSTTMLLLAANRCSNVLSNCCLPGGRYIAARASVPAGQLLELPYAELEADKLSAVARCYEFFGW